MPRPDTGVLVATWLSLNALVLLASILAYRRRELRHRTRLGRALMDARRTDTLVCRIRARNAEPFPIEHIEEMGRIERQGIDGTARIRRRKAVARLMGEPEPTPRKPYDWATEPTCMVP